MAKILTAQSIHHINAIIFQTNDEVVTGMSLSVEVNYGEAGLTHDVELWSGLTASQRERAQELYTLLYNKIKHTYLD